MKKLLFVVHTLQIGGAERVLLNILKNINKEKYDITVLALVNDGIYIEELKKIEGVKYKYLFNSYFKKQRENKNSKFYNLSKSIMNFIWKGYLLLLRYFPKEMYKKAIKENYDIEVAFLEGKVSKFVSNSNNVKSKKIAWIHTDINNLPKIKVFKDIEEEKECYNKFDKIVCVSGDVKKRFIERIGRTDNIFVQMNPIDSIDIIERSKEPIEEKLNNKGLVVSTVGRLVKEKGYDRLLEIHKRLIQEGILHTIWFIGDGIERKKLENYVCTNNLKDTVSFVGYTNNPYKYVKNSDVFVCSSRIEGLSSALIEATILEKAIVTTECPGTKEILGENGQSAVIVPNDTEELYKGLKQVLTNYKLRERLNEKIKTRSRLLDINNVMKQIEKILDE